MLVPVLVGKEPELIIAARNGNIDTIKVLLDNGADPNIRNYYDGWTPLIMAARNGNIDTIKVLLDNGADPNIKTDDGWTALMTAARYSNTSSNVETVKLLLENGADPNTKTKDGWAALIMGSRYSNTDSNIETVKLLLENGADPNIRQNNGWTSLIQAVRYSNTESNLETVKLLLENGADPNIKENDGYTALTAAAFYTNPETVKLLLEYRADPFIKLIPNMQMPKENEQLLAEYQWKILYQRDKDTARRYAKNLVLGENGNLNLPKEIWEIILLHKRQQMLCQNLSSNKNKEILYLFALELGIVIPDKESITKAKLCALISRRLTYGRDLSRQDKVEKDLDRHRNVIKNLAFLYGIDPEKSLPEILSQLSNVL